MTDVSPSDNKVDTFLSSLSQLSQEKLREDQERQQRLQRNIDELQLRLRSNSPIKSSMSSSNVSLGKSHYGYNIPDLKFNRSKMAEKEVPKQEEQGGEEDGPALPKRPAKYDTDDKAPPPLPRRKYKEQKQEDEEDDAPALPKRKTAKEEEDAPAMPRRKNQVEEINLLNPVARKSSFPMPKQTPAKPAKPTSVKPELETARPTVGQHRSFRDIENLIKSGDTTQKTTPTPIPASTPASASASTSSLTKQAPPPRPRPRPPPKNLLEPIKVQQPAAPSTPVKPVKSDWLTSLASAKTTTSTPQSPESRNGNKSPVMVKPKEKGGIEDEEAEFILKFKELKATKKKPLLPTPKPVEKPVPAIPPVKKSIEKPLKPVSLNEKKGIKDAKVFETKEEAEFKSKFEKLKTGPVPPRKPKTLSSFNEPPPEFQNKFNKIAAKSPQKLQRPATTGSLGNYKDKDTAELRSQLEKLVSARNKAGPIASPTKDVGVPKEVAAKKADTQSSDEKLVHPTKARTKGPKRRLPKTMLKGGEGETEKKKTEVVQPKTEPVPEIKTKKVGPPVKKHTKPKEIGELKPSSRVNGDFFI